MMTDAELRDAALAKFQTELDHLKKTTRGLKNFAPPPGSEWGQALAARSEGIELLKQVGISVPAPDPVPPTTDKLTWKPSGWNGSNPRAASSFPGYIPVTINNTGNVCAAPYYDGGNAIRLSNTADYVLLLDHRQTPQGTSYGYGLNIIGGRNVVLIGGQITIPTPLSAAEDDKRRAITFYGQQGIVHTEGLLIDGWPLRGISFYEDVAGSQIPIPAIHQIQNCRFEGISMYKGNSNNAHSDSMLLSSWMTGEIRIDKFTSYYDNTGFAFYGSYQPVGGNTKYIPSIKIKRSNLRRDIATLGCSTFGGPYAMQYINHKSPQRLEIDQLYVETGFQKSAGGVDCPGHTAYHWNLEDGFNQFKWNGGTSESMYDESQSGGAGDTQDAVITFTAPTVDNIYGSVTYGVPPNGDFCAAGVAGTSYVSPGYV